MTSSAPRDSSSRHTYAYIEATESGASAFGEDLADDSYSVSELSHYDEDKRARRLGKARRQSQAFPKTKVSQLPRQESAQPEEPEAEVENGKRGKGSSGSAEHSDEAGAVSGDSGDSDLTVTTFASFAQTKFQVRIPHTYSCAALPLPLLPKSDKGEHLAALASWVTILRIMGDVPDIDTGDTLVVAGETVPPATRVKSAFKTKYTKKDVEDVQRKYSELFKDPTLADTRAIPFLPGKADTMLDKVQSVCTMGIYRPGMRDELYCQLCKQLTNNPSRNSSVRGWVLMTLFAGSFAPSEKLAPSLTSFLREGPAELSEKVDKLLRRTCSVGTRGLPPSWLEFQAAKNGKPLLVPVSFMNGHRILCEVDSATSGLELLGNISERLGLLDHQGYSLYISLHTKISCLGHCQHRVLDAVSECEQHTKQMGLREGNALWRLFFRREYFTPWHIPTSDPVCTDLDYQQLKRGVTLGEYMVDKEDSLIDITAKFYYVERPDDTSFSKLGAFVMSFIPAVIQEQKPENYFLERVKTSTEAMTNASPKAPDRDAVKAEIVQYALEKFYVLFSRYYDVEKVSGPGLQLQDLVIGLNNKGIYLIDSADSLKKHFHFPEIVNMTKLKHNLNLRLANMSEYVLTSRHADDIYIEITSVLEGLRKRSTLAIATQDITQLDGRSETPITKSDILDLTLATGNLKDTDTVPARSRRNNVQSDVPKNLMYIVPTVSEPKSDILSSLVSQIRKDSTSFEPDQRKQQHSLQQYAKSYFRSSSESAMTKFLSKASFKRDRSDCLWAYTKDGLKRPLLKRTCNRDDINKLACHTFTSIQTYMANLVINDEAANYSLCSDWILDPARRNKYLRDEVFCQVVKQLTKNPERAGEDRGWVLLALLSSLAKPSDDLLEHLLAFVEGSPHPLGHQCLENLRKNRLESAGRLYSSHHLEHEMTSRQQPNVRVQVFLPSHSTQTIEVKSLSRIFDMKREIAMRLRLKSFAEYSLFLSSNDKVYCLPDRAYYFDCLSHAEIYWFKSSKRNSQSSGHSMISPLLVMLKKIWVNGDPGVDAVADHVFHFPQEHPNYLRAYHHIPDKRVVKLAALSYRAQFGSDDKRFLKFSEVAPQILPRGFLEEKSLTELQEAIQAEYNSCKDLTQAGAQSAFLQELSRVQTYGSVFFEVKQRHVPGLPKACLVALNYTGVHIISSKSQELLKTFEFHMVPNWAYDHSSFTFIISDGASTSKLLLETNVGHNMDDLLMSYVAWIMNYQMRKKSGFMGETAGESIC